MCVLDLSDNDIRRETFGKKRKADNSDTGQAKYSKTGSAGKHAYSKFPLRRTSEIETLIMNPVSFKLRKYSSDRHKTTKQMKGQTHQF